MTYERRGLGCISYRRAPAPIILLKHYRECLVQPEKMQHLLTGPAASNNSDRLACFPPVGLTGKTLSNNTFTLSGPSLSGKTKVRLLQMRDPAIPLFAEYYTGSLLAQDWFANYSTNARTDATAAATVEAVVTDLLNCGNGASVAAAGTNIGVANPTASIYAQMGADWVPAMVDLEKPGLPWIYVPSNWFLSVVLWSGGAYTGAAQTGKLQLEVWTGPGEFDIKEVNYTASAVNGYGVVFANALGSGATPSGDSFWVRPRSATMASAALIADSSITISLLVSTTNPTYNLAVTPPTTSVSTGTTTMCMIPVPEGLPFAHAATTPVMLETTLVHSSYLRCENTTKVLNKEGQFTAARLDLASANVWNATDSSFASALPMKRYAGAGEHGISCNVEPGTAFGSTRSNRYTYNKNDSGVMTHLFTLAVKSGDMANIIVFNDADVSTVTTFLVQYFVGWEYVTNYNTLPTGVTRFSSVDVEKAMNILATRNPFRRFERNPTVVLTGRPSRGPGNNNNRKKQEQLARRSQARPVPRPKPAPKPAAKPQGGKGKGPGGRKLASGLDMALAHYGRKR